jgi:hypothetical protein
MWEELARLFSKDQIDSKELNNVKAKYNNQII